jgi:hypothetical protein
MNYDDKPIIGRVAMISTSHSSPRDLMILATHRLNGLTAFEYEAGIIIPFIQFECLTWADRNVLRADGLSDDFLTLLMWAQSHKFDMLRLDRDGPILRELNLYEHQ